MLSLFAAVFAGAASIVAAQNGCGTQYGAELINQNCPWPYSGPEQLDTTNGPRGTMQGYNRCNATTQNQQSECVNAVANGPNDFCFFSSPYLAPIADTEGETVAYCTQQHGTRMVPAGAITGMQVVRTPGYLAFAVFLDQTKVNIPANDTGGELDPHGADNRGNPIGSLMYSTAFSQNGQTYQQVTEWHEFIGSNMACFKLCNPNYNNPGGNLCLNIYDTIGCTGNVPLNYAQINGTFSYCQGDNQQVPNGQALPIPATSACTTFQSTQLFANLPTISTSTPSSSSAAPTTSAAVLAVTSSPSSPTYTTLGSPSSSSSKGAATSSFQTGTILHGSVLSLAALAIGAAAVLL